MEMLYVLLVILAVTRLFGEVCVRINQPALVGELIAGVVLGSLIGLSSNSFPILSEFTDNRVFDALTDLGIFFLMLLAGLEMNPRDLAKASMPALWVALGGVILPMGLGLGIGYVFLPDSDWKILQILFLGVALSVTAVPLTVATLMELGQQDTRLGAVIVSAAVFDDIVSLFLITLLTAALKTGGDISLATAGVLAVKITIFFIAVVLIGRYVFPWVGRLVARLKIPHIEFSTILLWALAFGVLAEKLDMHFILGPYAAGLFFTHGNMQKDVYEDLRSQFEVLTMGFLAPIFFASIGLHIDISALVEVPLFLLVLVSAAFIGKIAGSGLAARASRFTWRRSLAIGVGMNARGAVELVIASIALKAGLFYYPDPAPPIIANMYSAVVLMTILATVFTPIMLRAVLKGDAHNSDPRDRPRQE